MITEINNPLVKHYLTRIRDKKTTFSNFREGVEKLSLILAYESSYELTVENKKISTPLAPYAGKELKQEIILVPVLRADTLKNSTALLHGDWCTPIRTHVGMRTACMA